jgi:uncharacterized protein (TIGR00369 family)
MSSEQNGMDMREAIRSWDREKANFVQMLDLSLEYVDRGKARVRMPFREEITNIVGGVHGGAIVSLCDTCFYIALASIYGKEQETTTTSISCNFLRQALPPHDLVADATVLKPGRRIVYGEVHVYSGEHLVAHATVSFLNTPPRK